MRFWDICKIAFTNFKFNKMRTALTIFGIAVGIGSIVFLVSFGYGLQYLTTQKIAGIQAIKNLHVTTEKPNNINLNDKTVKTFQANPEVANVSPVLNLPAQLVAKNGKSDISINAVTDIYFSLTGTQAPVAGDFFKGTGNDAVVSSALVKSVGVQDADIIGQSISLNIYSPTQSGGSSQFSQTARSYRVVGVVNDDSASYAYVPLASVSDLNIDNYNSVEVMVKNQNDLVGLKQQIEDMGLTVTSVADTIGQVNKIFGYVQISLAALGIIALAVASIGMFNTMTIALLERTRDIGIMKAVGTTDADIYKIFLTESISIGLLGGLSGVVFGWGLSKIINFLINLLAKSAGGQPSNLFTTPSSFVLEVVIFSFMVGLLTGFYPAIRAARLNPLEALRYE
jgi:putative ABC transport system permease protein